MNEPNRRTSRYLVIGPSRGWHADQLAAHAFDRGDTIEFASYESLSGGVRGATDSSRIDIRCVTERIGNREVHAQRSVDQFDAIIVRTMPSASLEKITFRLACLHLIADSQIRRAIPVVNSPRGLELAIDKFATAARLSAAGYNTPETRLVQSRSEALDAFDELGGDCVVKPLLGGEGRGVMRISDRQLAWYCFSTLDRLESAIQIQAFVPPGGSDERFLVVGDRVFGIRRENKKSFRSNVSAGASCHPLRIDSESEKNAIAIARLFGLQIASVDRIDNDLGAPVYLEVNAIPGWKGAQQVVDDAIADTILESIYQRIKTLRGESS